MLLQACSPPTEFEVLPLSIPDLPQENTSFKAIAARVNQSENGFVRFNETETTLWTSGYVTSSDAGGNFYKELYVQDKPNNPTLGLRLQLDQTALHTRYGVGEKIIIKLNGLGAGYHQGILSLGTYQADGIAALSETKLQTHLLRTANLEEIVPNKINLRDLHDQLVGHYIQLENVQFGRGEIHKTFAGESFDTYDGERRLVDCEEQHSLFLSSSSFSSFKSVVLDSLSGSISGILTRDYYNSKYILKINNPNQINFQHPRCDLFFEMPFEEETLGQFEKQGWYNFIEKGSVYWEVYEDANSLGQSLRIGAYRSGDKTSVCWLVTPSFDLRNLNQPQLALRTSTAYADKSKLEVLYSINFDGTQTGIKKAKWKKLIATLASEEDDDLLWIDSGALPLPKAERVTLAFRYSGSGKTEADGTFELDDIRLFEGE